MRHPKHEFSAAGSIQCLRCPQKAAAPTSETLIFLMCWTSCHMTFLPLYARIVTRCCSVEQNRLCTLTLGAFGQRVGARDALSELMLSAEGVDAPDGRPYRRSSSPQITHASRLKRAPAHAENDVLELRRDSAAVGPSVLRQVSNIAVFTSTATLAVALGCVAATVQKCTSRMSGDSKCKQSRSTWQIARAIALPWIFHQQSALLCALFTQTPMIFPGQA